MSCLIPILTLLLFTPFAALHAQDTAARAKGKKGIGSDAPAGQRYTYKHSAGKPREMEIYFPPNHDPAKAKAPGMILFHGGAWTGGSLSQFRRACAYFASRGLVCATAEYQMLKKADAAKMPEGETIKRVCITDAKSAIRWFKQKAPEFGVDSNRIITGGGSAGGHISVLATTNPGLNDPADPKDIDTSVVAYLLFNPAFSTSDRQDSEVDVLRHLRPGFAPAIVFFGDNDNWKEGWDAAYAKLKELGNTTTEEHIARGQSHGFFNADPWQSVTLRAADDFLVRRGLLEGSATLKAPETGERLEVSATPSDGFFPLFNGKDLTGWDGDPQVWKVAEGLITGTCEGPEALKNNTFLIWRGGTVKDFELRATVRVIGDNNSGIQYRSREVPEVAPWVISGYQCDIHPATEHLGATYEERGRSVFGFNGRNVMSDPEGALWLLSEHEPVAVEVSQWNEYTIVARGNHLIHKINGRISSEFIDHDEKRRALDGLLAIQLHRGNANTVQIKDVRLKTITDAALVPYSLPLGAKKLEKPKVTRPQGTGPVQAPNKK